MLTYIFRITALFALLGTTSVQAGEPSQGWASKGNLVNLQPNGIKLDRDDVLDRLHIQEAFARWGIGFDEARSEVIASLFTADGIFEVTEGNTQPIHIATGRDKVVASALSARQEQGDQRRHLISNVVIDRLTPTEATAIAYALVAVANDGLVLNASVIYSAELRREKDGVWRFSRLIVGMDKYVGKKPQTSR